MWSWCRRVRLFVHLARQSKRVVYVHLPYGLWMVLPEEYMEVGPEGDRDRDVVIHDVERASWIADGAFLCVRDLLDDPAGAALLPHDRCVGPDRSYARPWAWTRLIMQRIHRP